jgi:hypothetical protein
MNASTGLLIYFVGYMVTTFFRGFFIDKPDTKWEVSDWKIGNIFLPIVWPIYLPGFLAHRAGDFTARFLIEVDE